MDAISSEESSDEGLITRRKKKKVSLLQKLRSKWVRFVKSLRAFRLRRKVRVGKPRCQAHHMRNGKFCLNFHFPHPKLKFSKSSTKQKLNPFPYLLPKDVPKGFLPVYVGQEHQRFVIPVFYLNDPLFENLLKGIEEHFGFQQEGALLIPCEVSDFELLRSRIGSKYSCKSRRRQWRSRRPQRRQQRHPSSFSTEQ